MALRVLLFLKNCFNAFGNVTYALVQKMQAIQNGV